MTNGTEEADKAAESDKNGTVEDADEAATGTPDEEEKETEGEEKSSDSADKKDVEKAAPEGRNAVESFKDNMDVVIREDLKALFQKFGTVKVLPLHLNCGMI